MHTLPKQTLSLLPIKGEKESRTKKEPNKRNRNKRNSPPARRGAVLAEATSAELAGHEGGAAPAHHLAAVLALVHLVTAPAVEGIAPVAHPDLVVGLVLVAPVTSRAYVGVAVVARHLDRADPVVVVVIVIVIVVAVISSYNLTIIIIKTLIIVKPSSTPSTPDVSSPPAPTLTPSPPPVLARPWVTGDTGMELEDL